MKNTVNRLLCAGILPALLLAGCSRRNEATVGTPANPLVVVLSPAHVPASPGALDEIRRRLEAASGLSVRIEAARDPAAAINAFSSGLADAGLLTLEEFLVAREEYNVKAELQALRREGLSDYEGVIITRLAGGAAAVEELSGKKVGFVGPYSVSGFTLPAIHLENAAVKAQIDFAPSHEAVLKKLLAGEVAAAATYARQVSRDRNLKVLAVTGRVPNEPLVMRKGLAADRREALKAAFMSLSSTPEGRKALAAVADITGFRHVEEGVYRPLHDLLRSEGKAVYDLVPDGWEIQKLNQPYQQGL
jgi:phosphonate transport system substrate-binding protein